MLDVDNQVSICVYGCAEAANVLSHMATPLQNLCLKLEGDSGCGMGNTPTKCKCVALISESRLHGISVHMGVLLQPNISMRHG